MPGVGRRADRAARTLASHGKATMPVLKSTLDIMDETYRDNRRIQLEALAALEQQLDLVRAGGGERYARRHHERGRLLVRERLELLLDRDTPFLELSSLAAWGSGFTVGASILTGIGVVSGMECMIIAHDPTVRGGAMNPFTLKKNLRALDIARVNRLPVIYLVESGGADLPTQSELFVDAGKIFQKLTQLSAARIPTVALVFGNSTAGGAYVPGMCDYAVLVDGQAKVFLGGPPLVKMATGEITDEESLGGAEMHSRVSGLSDYLAESELDGIRIAREIVSHFNLPKPRVDLTPIEEPLYPVDELLGIASADPRVPFDAREVIARIVDGSRFSEFKAGYGTTLVTGFARVHGMAVGILANNGVLMSESAAKGAQFIALANQQNIPLIFLQNITGFMVGRSYEEQGIIRNGAKLINAVSNSTVPAITIMMGGSYGAGNYAMCGRAYEPRFLFTWPNHRIAVMGPQQLSGVMDIIKREALIKSKQPVDEEKLAAARIALEGQIQRESDCYFATARLWDDGIIDPRDTRTVLGISLSAAYNRAVEGTMEWGVSRH